jgi:two-component system, chemotaxis family, protein-glutamate methylesterase/glutaminase
MEAVPPDRLAPIELIVIGASLGGLSALRIVLAALPDGFLLPIVVVQHRAADTAGLLSPALERFTALRIIEPQDKEVITPGQVFLAPADYHLLVEPGAFALSTEGPVSCARPSIDVLFESAADAYGARTLAVVLTGANTDGMRGAAMVKARGGCVVVQDPGTAESSVLPRATISATAVDQVLPLPQIAALLAGFVGE